MQLNQDRARGAYIGWWPQGDGRKKGNAAPGQVGRRPSLDAKAEMSDRVRANLVSGHFQPLVNQARRDRSASFVQAIANADQPLSPALETTALDSRHHADGQGPDAVGGTLVQLMQAICAYHRLKPQSQRRISVLALARQALFKANELARTRWAIGAING